MLESYDKIAVAKRNTEEYKKDLAMQEDWLKKNRPTQCAVAQNFTVPELLPEVYEDNKDD